MSKDTKLLPCPFCGGEASKRLFYGGKYGIYCDECSARVGGLYDTEAEAIESWNTRAERMSDAVEVMHAIGRFRRDLNGYYDQLMAHSDLQRHCDNQRKRIAELEGLYAKAKAEIAELKEQTRWMAQTDSRWEAAVRDLEQAKAENAELRELVDELYPLADYGAMDASELDKAHDLMRKLGWEVD